jgi:hypothetical protein
MGEPIAVYAAIDAPTDATRVRGARVLVVDYQPEWETQFETLRRDLDVHLAEKLPERSYRIEHVGSTSVPGLAAKPILDIDIIFAEATDFELVAAALTEMGYEHQGDLGIPGREEFRYANADVPRPVHHLYAGKAESPEIRRHLAFRDFLRANDRAVIQYGALKRRLAGQYPWDRDRYTNEKSPFITGILREIDPSLTAD